ncbi:MAG: hypothetical protein ACRDV1_02300 [Actinomycetes bacterium]
MADADESTRLPAPDSTMQVAVWDSSGEALIEVTDGSADLVAKFWLEFEDGKWLVSGVA